MRIAKKTNWIKGRGSTTLNGRGSSISRKPGFMANMRNKNVTRRIGKSRQRTPLTYSFGRNDSLWHLFDMLD